MQKILGVRVTIAEVAAELHDYAADLATYDPADITEYGCDDAGGDVRLQVRGGGWSVHTGDSQYDQDHRGAWGCGWIRAGASMRESRETARELIDEAADCAAGMEG